MRHGAVLALCLVLGVAAVRVPAAPAFMPVGEIVPGMKGVGKTVFQGNELEDFQASIIGVLENVMGPQRNLILARLEGGPLERTGVIAGMSGSPVYVDGRLIGAVSYSLGSFVKDPIAGITPIAEMTEATDVARRRTLPATPAPPRSPREMLSAFRDALVPDLAFAEPGGVRGIGLGQADAARYGQALRPIATPLQGAGFDPRTEALLAELLQGAGFAAQLGATSARTERSAPANTTPLRPGDPIGVSLVGGDLSLGATGTVTHVDGERIYAFGHPLFNIGPTNLPLTRATVLTILPSYLSSSKLASLGDIVGTLTQDRATAIGGTLGAGPSLVPISMTLEGDSGPKRTFAFTVVKDQLLTPLLTLVGVLNTLQSYERQVGAATFAIKGQARVRGHAPVALDDVFSGDPPSLGAAMYIVSPISTLLQNDRAGVDVEGLDLTISSSEQPRTATIERAWVDASHVRPGQTVTLKVVTRTYRGEETLRSIPVAVPSSASGSVSLVVSDGPRLAQAEQRDARRALQTQGIDQLIRVLNGARRSNRLYVRLVTNEAGATLHGESLPGLPPSVLTVLEGDRQNGGLRSLSTSTLGEWELPLDTMVTGTKTLTLSLDLP